MMAAQPTITTHVDVSGLIPWRLRTDAAVRRAAQMAGSSAIRSMRAEASRLIRERKAMKVSQIGKALTIVYPTDKQKLLWKVKASGNIVPVIAFPVRQTRKGISTQINRGRWSFIRGAFLATMKSGHRGVFMRKGRTRLPIREAFTTRVSDAFRDAMPKVAERGKTIFASTFKRVLPLETAKRRRA